MEFEREHKTEQIGASYDTDYKVITRCIPDCPACAQKELVKWGMGSCIEHGGFTRFACLSCLQALQKHFELEGK